MCSDLSKSLGFAIQYIHKVCAGVLYSGVITQGSLFHALFAQAGIVVAITFPHVILPGL